MKKLTKFLAGAVGAATLSVSLAAPAEAQRYYRDYDRRYDRGIDAGDVIAGVAVIGGIAAIASALSRDGSRYGYDNRYRYRDGYRYAVNSCAYQAERYGRGRVQITDVDRIGSDRYRVRGIINGGYDQYDRGYDRRWDRDYGYGDFDRYDRDGFTCTARGNGRITNFRLNDGYAYRY
jgi:hypothetical protein